MSWEKKDENYSTSHTSSMLRIWWLGFWFPQANDMLCFKLFAKTMPVVKNTSRLDCYDVIPTVESVLSYARW